MKNFFHVFTISLLLIAIYLGVFIYNGTFQDTPVVNLIKNFGYPVEIHRNITTKDGYLLDLYRIKTDKTNEYNKTRPAVLVMHGLLTSSLCFVTIENSLAYVLADRGFDVWLGNARGTVNSRNHVNLTANDDKYWDFSWHEIGLYDTRAFIEHIINETGQKKIHYVGHSQGTTGYFVLASIYPEINRYIKHMVVLAPIVYLQEINNQFVQVALYFKDLIKSLCQWMGIHSLAPPNNFIPFLSQFLCNSTLMTPFCGLVLNINSYGLTSFTQNTDANFVQYVQSILQGCAFKQFYHYGQLFHADKFQHYDYGESENYVKYNATQPPEYDLSQVTVPMSIYYSTVDHYRSNIERVSASFPNVTRIKHVALKHLDFVIGRNRLAFYNDVIDDMLKYT